MTPKFEVLDLWVMSLVHGTNDRLPLGTWETWQRKEAEVGWRGSLKEGFWYPFHLLRHLPMFVSFHHLFSYVSEGQGLGSGGADYGSRWTIDLTLQDPGFFSCLLAMVVAWLLETCHVCPLWTSRRPSSGRTLRGLFLVGHDCDSRIVPSVRTQLLRFLNV